MIGVIWKSSYSHLADWNVLKECKTENEALYEAEIEKKKHPDILIFAGRIEGEVKSEVIPTDERKCNA